MSTLQIRRRESAPASAPDLDVPSPANVEEGGSDCEGARLHAEQQAQAAASLGMTDDEFKLHRRFDRMGRLVGDAGMHRLFNSHAMVIGIGGVGSWAAEALVRAGVGRVTLVDFDLVCVTNVNRQLHAMKGTTGKAKVEIMAERLRMVNPNAQIVPVREFYEGETSVALLGEPGSDDEPDVVIDAIDNIQAKAHLIGTCVERGIRVVVSGGASGRMDPLALRAVDLAQVEGDAFLYATRKVMRKRFPERFRGSDHFGVTAVYSTEPIREPLELAYDNGQGFRCVCPQGSNGKHSCDKRNVIYGTAGFVTGAFGLACASQATAALLSAD